VATPPSPARLALGRAIRDLRRRREMSQEELALRSGLQRKTIHQMEVGKTDPRLESVMRVAEALDTSIVDLMESLDGYLPGARG
jgi:transcriptional regulator with XRE-family HTH domain